MPAIPSNTVVADWVIKTPWAERRSRFYYTPDTPPPGITELETIANRIMVHFQASWFDIASAKCYSQRVECRYYGAGFSLFEANSTAAAFPGGLEASTAGSEDNSELVGSADTLPDENCLIIQKRTGNVGRRMAGRVFICGLSEQIQNAGIIEQDFRPLVVALANKVPMDINVTGLYATVLHARHYNRKDNTMHPITKAYAISTLGTRRDRRRPLKLSRL